MQIPTENWYFNIKKIIPEANTDHCKVYGHLQNPMNKSAFHSVRKSNVILLHGEQHGFFNTVN